MCFTFTDWLGLGTRTLAMGDSDRSPTPEAGGGGGDRLHTTRNGRAGSPGEDIPARSPSPRYRRYSDSTPTRSPSPLPLGDGYDDLENTSSRKTKSVSFHSHTNWKSDRKIQSGECCICFCLYVCICECLPDSSIYVGIRLSLC